MSEIIAILMRRDGMTRQDAKDLVRQTLDEIDDAISCGCGYDYITDIVEYNLGLEPDYLDILLMGC